MNLTQEKQDVVSGDEVALWSLWTRRRVHLARAEGASTKIDSPADLP